MNGFPPDRHLSCSVMAFFQQARDATLLLETGVPLGGRCRDDNKPSVAPPRNAFSLIELLVVMAIFSILVTLIVPAFGSIGKAAGLNGAGNKVLGLVNTARQNSLADNAMTALVVVTDPSVDSRYQLFTIFEMLPHTDNSTAPQPSEWKQISKWETLGTGMIVSNWASSPDTPAPALPSMRYGNSVIDSTNVKAVIFMPDGSTFGNITTSIQLAEGFMPKGSNTPIFTGSKKNGAAANRYKLTILKSTGRVKIDR